MVLIVDTYHHIEGRVEYLGKLKKCRQRRRARDHRLQKDEDAAGPAGRAPVAEDQVESELKSAGFTIVSADKDLLPYQYIIKAR